jgi:alpha-ketoglutarate-dependent sulfate ester dioxygenase
MVSSPQQGAGASTLEAVEVVPLTLHISAKIRGVDLAEVIFFRGQHLNHAQHVARARQFGGPTIGHAVFGHVEGYPEIYSVAKNRTANENRSGIVVEPPNTGP